MLRAGKHRKFVFVSGLLKYPSRYRISRFGVPLKLVYIALGHLFINHFYYVHICFGFSVYANV